MELDRQRKVMLIIWDQRRLLHLVNYDILLHTLNGYSIVNFELICTNAIINISRFILRRVALIGDRCLQIQYLFHLQSAAAHHKAFRLHCWNHPACKCHCHRFDFSKPSKKWICLRWSLYAKRLLLPGSCMHEYAHALCLCSLRRPWTSTQGTI